MLRKDYYVVLGVSRDETPQGIRSAFRALARRYHPDRAGPRASHQFQQLTEAYQVLSDTKQRAAYDRGLAHMDDVDGPSHQPIAPEAPGPRPVVEPLVPQRLDPLRDVVVGGPSQSWLRHRFAEHFHTPRPGRRLQPLHLDVRLPRSQAVRGGLLAFGLPVYYPCARCHGSGLVGGRPCPSCGGDALREEEEQVMVPIPPMVRDGAVFEVPLGGLGLSDMFLELHLQVV